MITTFWGCDMINVAIKLLYGQSVIRYGENYGGLQNENA